ncbi:hypothetical protein CYMTET_14100 [Cymbomonas tetramitiformis]|uniref:Uncharacterized protein n=1 Tax=Cymbomonas tetramitiformis TaxID=36881 RepID=A0AAE0GH04_9CHLO|nr:hypothetical protein CYMTET_14100 [Cymbomonas tetramitiformis]
MLLLPSEDVSLTPGEMAALQTHQAKLEQWGWRWQCSPTSLSVQLLSAPHIEGKALRKAPLKEHLASLVGTSAAQWSIPLAAVRLMQSKACRSAIMFGDELSHQECTALLDRLKQTRLALQCAHGRPTMAPLACMDAVWECCQMASPKLYVDDSAQRRERIWRRLNVSHLKRLLKIDPMAPTYYN